MYSLEFFSSWAPQGLTQSTERQNIRASQLLELYRVLCSSIVVDQGLLEHVHTKPVTASSLPTPQVPSFGHNNSTHVNSSSIFIVTLDNFE